MVDHLLGDKIYTFAFADDVAMLLAELLQVLPRVVELFGILKKGAGLDLNALKTVVVPFYTNTDLRQLARLAAAVAPSLRGCKVEFTAKHLGVMVGPMAWLNPWGDTVVKFQQRVAEVGKLHGGWSSQCYLYQLVAVSVMSY